MFDAKTWFSDRLSYGITQDLNTWIY